MTRIERAKYAGELAATRFPDLAGRFQFWCGGSGRRYATSRYLPGQTPAYDLAVSLYVKRTEAGPQVIAISPTAICARSWTAHRVPRRTVRRTT
jgi:hypothetical protein